MDASFEVSDHERLGKIRVAEVNGEPFLCLTDMLKLLNIFTRESIVPEASAVSDYCIKTSIEEFASVMRPCMSSRLYRVLTWSDESYLEDITKEKFFRLRSAGEKTYQELLSLKQKFDELRKS